jgi:hypothetical protein
LSYFWAHVASKLPKSAQKGEQQFLERRFYRSIKINNFMPTSKPVEKNTKQFTKN